MIGIVSFCDYFIHNQKVFTNKELPLSDAIQLSDFMCCQNSTAILDSVFFEKPFAFISLTQAESLADYIFRDKKSRINEFHRLEDLRNFIYSLFHEKADEAVFKEKTKKLKRELLYLADGNACGRLIDFSRELCSKGQLSDESLVALHIERI